LFKFKRGKYLSWRFICHWRDKSKLSRRMQI
jgi:hypothetical protein